MRLDDDPTRMAHIIGAAEEAIGYVSKISYLDFMQSRVLQHSVVRCIEIVGEASARLSSDIRRENAEIPWVDIIGMRNRIVHAYYDIDIEIIWKTATEDLPELLPEFRRIARILADGE